jgi:hypothetical protein
MCPSASYARLNTSLLGISKDADSDTPICSLEAVAAPWPSTDGDQGER